MADARGRSSAWGRRARSGTGKSPTVSKGPVAVQTTSRAGGMRNEECRLNEALKAYAGTVASYIPQMEECMHKLDELNRMVIQRRHCRTQELLELKQLAQQRGIALDSVPLEGLPGRLEDVPRLPGHQPSSGVLDLAALERIGLTRQQASAYIDTYTAFMRYTQQHEAMWNELQTMLVRHDKQASSETDGGPESGDIPVPFRLVS